MIVCAFEVVSFRSFFMYVKRRYGTVYVKVFKEDGLGFPLLPRVLYDVQ